MEYSMIKKTAKLSAALIVLLLASLLPAAPLMAQSEKRPLIVFDNAHGQYYNAERLDYFLSDLRKVYSVYISGQPVSDELLSNATVYILTNPRSPLTDEEAAAIKRFVERGGVAVIMGDWYRYIDADSLNKVTEWAGIRFTRTSVWDKQHYDYRYYYPLARINASGSLGSYLSRLVSKPVKFSGCYLEVNGSAKTFLVSWGSAFAYNPDRKVVKSGSMPLAAYVKAGKGYIIAIGSSRVAATSHFYGDKNLGNRAFMLALIAWAVKQAGYTVLPVKISIQVSPYMLPVGVESDVEVNVTVEALGENLKGLTVKVELSVVEAAKSVPVLNNTEAVTMSFQSKAKPSKPGEIPITVTVSSSLGTKTYTYNVYAVEEGGGVIFDYTHGEYYWLSRLTGFAETLSKYGTVAASKRPIDEALKYAKIFVLLNPRDKFTYSEASTLRNWVKNGGILLVFGSYYAYLNPVALNTVTSPAGINWLDGSVRDKKHNVEGRDYLVYLSSFPDNPLAKAASKGVDEVFFSGTSLSLGGDAVPILVGHDSTYVVDKDGNVLANGSKVVAVAVAKLGDGYIVAVGGVAPVLDYYYGVKAYEKNRRFFENLLSALASGAAPKPPAKKEVYLPALKARFVAADRRILVGEAKEALLIVSNLGNGSAKNLMVQFVGSNLELSTDGKTWNRALTVKLGDLQPVKQDKVKIYYKALEPGDASLRIVVIAENTDPLMLKADFQAVAPPQPTSNPLFMAGVAVVVVAAAAVAAWWLKTRKKGKKRK